MFPLTAIAGISHHISIWREGVIGEGQALGDAAPRHLPSENHSVLPVVGSSSLLVTPYKEIVPGQYTIMCEGRINEKKKKLSITNNYFPWLITFVLTLI